MTTRANFLTTHADDLPEVREISMAEWLAARLAHATLVPLDDADMPAQPVTLNEGQNNGR